MTTRIPILMLIISALLLCGCGGGDDGPTTPPADVPAIASATPTTVTVGTVVTLTGSHFGSSGQLHVNDEEAAVAAWSDTSITFTVPTGLSGTSLSIQVTSGGEISAVFTLAFTEPGTGPVITSIDPPTLAESSPVSVYGQGFGTSGELLLDGDAVGTTLWADTLIMFTVPQGITHSPVDLQVVSGGQTSAVFQAPFSEPTERQLTFGVGTASTPCWSADGSHIYFSADGPNGDAAFYSVPFLGGDVVLLFDSEGDDFYLDVQYYQAGNLIWSNNVDEAVNPGGDWEIHEGNSGFNPQRYLDTDHLTNETNERYPVWNHDLGYGVDCAWTQDRQAGSSMIYVRRNGVIEDLISGFYPCFNPVQGNLMAFQQPAPTYGYDIMTISMQPDSSPELLYRDETTSLGLAWGHAGQIAYQRGYHIWIMDEDGSNHRKLTDGHDRESSPKFSPNGQWITFTRWVTTESEVFVARVP